MSKIVNNFFKILVAFLPAILWASLIYYLSGQQVLPSLSLSTWDFLFKKSAHIFVYAVLYLLLFRAFHKTTNLPNQQVWLVPLFFTLAYAVFDEVHQTFTPGRYGTLRDIGFDSLGMGLVLMRKFGYI